MLWLALYSSLRRSSEKFSSFCAFAYRELASKTPVVEVEEIDLTKPHTVVCSSGTIACWHPDPPFPYEHTRPIDPEALKGPELSSSVLSNRVLENDIRLKYKRGPADHELQEIFYTKKHRFAPRYREKKLYAVSAPVPRRK